MKPLKILFAICALFFGAGLIAHATGLPILPVAGTMLVLSLVPRPEGVLRTEIDVAQLIAQFGQYYVKEGQNLARLKTLIRQKSITPMHAALILTENTRQKGSTAVIGEVIQAFQKAFTAKGSPKFLPETYDLFNVKIDTEFYPDEIVATWLGFLASIPEPDRAKWPIVRYIMENLLMERKGHDLELKAYYGGQYSEPVAGTPGSATNSMDGIRKLLTSNRVNSLNLGTVTSSNILDKVEKAVDDIPTEFDSVPMKLFMSSKRLRDYARDYRDTFGTHVNYNERKAVEVDFAPNFEIVGLPSMNGYDDIWITPAMNFQYMRRTRGESTPRIESAKRQVSVMMDWWEGFAFGILEMVWIHQEAGSGSGSGS